MGGEWSGHCSYICLAASLPPYLCVCTLCAKIQSIATPAVEREGQQPHWTSRAGQTDGEREETGNTPQVTHVFSRVNERLLLFHFYITAA